MTPAGRERREVVDAIRRGSRPRLSPWLVAAPLLAPFALEWLVRERRIGHAVAAIADGTCLRPWILDGDFLVADTKREPRPGDLVLTSTRAEIRAGLGTPRQCIDVRGCKQLVLDAAGAAWLSCADGAFPAAEHTIVGPVVAVLRLRRGRVPLAGMDFPLG